MLCCVKGTRGKGWVTGRRKVTGRKGDPGIHMHITEGKIAGSDLFTALPAAPALLRLQAQGQKHSQSNLLYFHLQGEKEVK